jgi:hypothetical protein
MNNPHERTIKELGDLIGGYFILFIKKIESYVYIL